MARSGSDQDNEVYLDEFVSLEDFMSDGVDYSSRFITNDTFATVKDVQHWANAIAREIGFHLVITSHKNNSRQGIKRVYLRCWRYGEYRGKVDNVEELLERSSSTKSCGCPFVIVAWHYPESPWQVRVCPGEKGIHNHKFVVYEVGHRHGNPLSEPIKEHVRDMTRSGCTPATIHTSILQHFPDANANVRQIYNVRHKMRVEEADGRTSIQNCLHLAKTNGYLSWTMLDENGELRQVFMCHPFSLSLLRSYPNVILIDTTYKTNAAKWPLCEIVGVTPTDKNFLVAYSLMRDEQKKSYLWLLQKLMELFSEGVVPKCFVTDRDEALLWALNEVFPNSFSLLCVWHIGNDVEKNVDRLTGGRKNGQGGTFRKHYWSKIVYSKTVNEFLSNWHFMTGRWNGRNAAVVNYCVNTWLKHVERFVCAWTDKVFHLGCTATNRVESQHSVAKYYIKSSQGTFDRLWVAMHQQITNQHVEVMRDLEQSRSCELKKYPSPVLRSLHGVVSHHALKLLTNEVGKIDSMNEETLDACDHWLKNTHGLPCRCTIFKQIRLERRPQVNVEDIDIFWRTLVVDDVSHRRADHVEERSQYSKYMHSLIEEATTQDETFYRGLARVINEYVHPEATDIPEPTMSPPRKGRPEISKSTRRMKGHYDYGTPQSKGTPGRSSKKSSSSSVGTYKRFDREMMFWSTCPYASQIPDFLHPYVDGWNDVVGDGNCGFRVIAEAHYGDQHNWFIARQSMKAEINGNMEQYRRAYGFNDGPAHALQRIGAHADGAAPPEHWLETPSDLYAAATLSNSIWVCIASRPGDKDHAVELCSTILPLRAAAKKTKPNSVNFIAHVNGNHYIHLFVKNDCPLPPVHAKWRDAADATVRDWDSAYERRFQQWVGLREVRQSSRVAPNYVNLD